MCSGPPHLMEKKTNKPTQNSEKIVKYVLMIKKIKKVDFRRSMFNLSCPYSRLQKESEKPTQSQDIGLGSTRDDFAPNWFLCSFIVGSLPLLFLCPESGPRPWSQADVMARSSFQWRKWRHQEENSFWSIVAGGLSWCFISVLVLSQASFSTVKYFSVVKYKLVFLQDSEGVEQLEPSIMQAENASTLYLCIPTLTSSRARPVDLQSILHQLYQITW